MKILTAFIVAFLLSSSAFAQTTRPAFIIGIDAQPPRDDKHDDMFAFWKGLGVNTLVRYDDGPQHSVSIAEWSQKARAHNLYYIRRADDDLTADAADPFLLAFAHGDEPDGHNTPPQQLGDAYKQWKTAAPEKPVFINFDGFHLDGKLRQNYVDYMAAADWICADEHVMNRGYTADNLNWTGKALDTLRHWLPEGADQHKRWIAYVECSDQRFQDNRDLIADHAAGKIRPGQFENMRGPTPDEMRALIWDAVIHGATGIIYFPQQIYGGFRYDATTPEIQAEMKIQDAKLAELAPLLLSDGEQIDAPKPFEAARRTLAGKKSLIVVNLSAEKAKFKDEDFGPYEAKVLDEK